MSWQANFQAAAGQRMTPQQLRHEEALQAAYRQVKNMRAWYLQAMMYCIIIPGLWILNLMTGGPIWAHWPTLGWGAGLALHGVSVFAGGTFFSTEWQEKKVAEIMAREQLKVVSSEKQLVQAQMRMLQAQIEPHFLFNTLATIQSLIDRAPEKAHLMMDNFIAYLRQSLSASRADTGTVRQEFDLLQNYLALLKIRMGDRLQFSFDLPEALQSVPLAPMLLQPLVENAIKHGLEPKIDGGFVRISAARDGAAMLLTVHDNGLGFTHQADSRGTGLGLANLRERLAVLYDGQAALTVADANPGTTISIRIPITD